MHLHKVKSLKLLWKRKSSKSGAGDVLDSSTPTIFQVVLLFCIGGVLLYFFGFFEAFAAGTNSAFTWIWSAWNKETGYIHAKASPVVLVALLVIAWRRARFTTRRTDWTGLILVIAGIILFLISVRMVQARLAIIAFILICFGGVLFMAGREAAVPFLFPAFFMLLVVPVPLPPEFGQYWIAVVSKSLQLAANPIGVTIRPVGDDMFMALPGEASSYFKSAMSPNGVIQASMAVSALYCYLFRCSLPRLGMMMAASPLFALVGLITKGIVGMIIFKLGFSSFAANAYNEVWGHILVLAPVALVGMIISYQILSVLEAKIRNRKPSEAA